MAVDVRSLEISERDLGRRAELGRGGMSTVYSVPDLRIAEAPSVQWVYKSYKPGVGPASSHSLKKLVDLRLRLSVQRRIRFDGVFNWPVRVVMDVHGTATGVILPLIAKDFFLTLNLSSGRARRKPAELQYLFQDEAYCARVGIPFPSHQERLQLCRSLAYAFAVLDRENLVYGDLSARNVLYRLRERPSVHLVDCDTIRPIGAASALGVQPHSPNWLPPEAVDAMARRDGVGFGIQSQATDRYKLGLAILRMLAPGLGASARTDPEVARDRLPPRLFSMLTSSLSHDPTNRPTASDWYRAIAD